MFLHYLAAGIHSQIRKVVANGSGDQFHALAAVP